MSESDNPPTLESKQQLWAIFDRLLPLLDNLADKLRFIFVFGLLLLVWVGVWLLVIKHYPLSVSILLLGVGALPVLVLLRFWLALEELKDLPTIAGQMMGDAKTEIREKVQTISQQKHFKISLIGAGKGLFSVAAMAKEAAGLAGSYISVVTLLNPFMLVLGVMSMFFVVLLALIGLVLVFFAI